MTDTPTLHAAVDPREQPILEKLLVIRDELTLLKQDRSTYVKSSDVMSLYERVHEQVHLLTEIRADKPKEQTQGTFLAFQDRCQHWLTSSHSGPSS